MRQKTFWWQSFLTLIFLVGVVHGQSPSLQLRTEILSQDYCVGDSELDGVRLKLRLTYTNNSRQPLILYKDSTLVSRIMISRDFAEDKANHFEVNSSLTQVTSGGEGCYVATAIPTRCFIVLRPGASYKTEAVAGTFAVRGDAREIAGAVKSGNHVLRLETITWNGSDEMATTLRKRWSPHGVLWYEPVTSLPMLFTVRKDRRVRDCP